MQYIFYIVNFQNKHRVQNFKKKKVKKRLCFGTFIETEVQAYLMYKSTVVNHSHSPAKPAHSDWKPTNTDDIKNKFIY